MLTLELLLLIVMVLLLAPGVQFFGGTWLLKYPIRKWRFGRRPHTFLLGRNFSWFAFPRGLEQTVP